MRFGRIRKKRKDQKEKEGSKKPLLEKEGRKKMKTIDQYFVKPSDPLN